MPGAGGRPGGPCSAATGDCVTAGGRAGGRCGVTALRQRPAPCVPTLRQRARLPPLDPEADALIFPGIKGGPLRRSNFNKMAAWPHAVRAIGAEGLHFHDLRHTGNHFAAASGASMKDLMARMGTTASALRSSTSTKHKGPTWPSQAPSTPISRPPSQPGSARGGSSKSQLTTANGPWRSARPE